jgi:hypothetical protein
MHACCCYQVRYPDNVLEYNLRRYGKDLAGQLGVCMARQAQQVVVRLCI